MIKEIQFVCLLLTTLIGIMLAFVLPRFAVPGKVYDVSRKMLVASSFLVALHFGVQLFLSYTVPDPMELRTSVNLFFWFPITFFLHMSLVYLIRRGRIRRKIWYFIPIVYLLALAGAAFMYLFLPEEKARTSANLVMAVFYGIVLIFCTVLELQGFIRLDRSIRLKGNMTYIPVVKWTKWSSAVMMVVNFAFPFMVFSDNAGGRAFYGFLFILSGLVYQFNFIGYGLSRVNNRIAASMLHPYSDRIAGDEEKKNADGHAALSVSSETGKPERTGLNPVKLRQIEFAVNDFVRNDCYSKPGITIREASEMMGITPSALKAWLTMKGYARFNAWIVSLRLKKAKTILAGDRKISDGDVARLCGFCDRQYFQHVFARYVGMTPTRWVQENVDEEV